MHVHGPRHLASAFANTHSGSLSSSQFSEHDSVLKGRSCTDTANDSACDACPTRSWRAIRTALLEYTPAFVFTLILINTKLKKNQRTRVIEPIKTFAMHVNILYLRHQTHVCSLLTHRYSYLTNTILVIFWIFMMSDIYRTFCTVTFKYYMLYCNDYPCVRRADNFVSRFYVIAKQGAFEPLW